MELKVSKTNRNKLSCFWSAFAMDRTYIWVRKKRKEQCSLLFVQVSNCNSRILHIEMRHQFEDILNGPTSNVVLCKLKFPKLTQMETSANVSTD